MAIYNANIVLVCFHTLRVWGDTLLRAQTILSMCSRKNILKLLSICIRLSTASP